MKTGIETTGYIVKDKCEQYYVHVVGHSWGTFTLSEKGDFFIHSDWGYWAFNWRSFGPSFKVFLSEINTSYLIDKIEANQMQFYGIKKKIQARTKEAIIALFEAFQEHLKTELQNENRN